MSIYDSFTGLYKLSKTLRFELKPIGKTAEYLKDASVLAGDIKRDEDYAKVKTILDEAHKALIERALANVDIDWTELAEKRRQKLVGEIEEKDWESVQEKYRKQILKHLKADSDYNSLTGATPKDYLENHFRKGEGPTATFERFACYFVGFQENRCNLYTAEKQATAVPYRVVNDNFSKFASNIEKFAELVDKFPEIVEAAGESLKDSLNGQTLSEVFTINAFNSCLTQSGIDKINLWIGGNTRDEKTKVQGINEFINLYIQQHPELSRESRPKLLAPLYKQILSDRETFSFVAQNIERDEDLVNDVKAYRDYLNKEVEVENLKILLSDVCNNVNGLYVSSDALTEVAKRITGRWEAIASAIRDGVEKRFAGIKNAEKKIEKEIESLKKRKYVSLEELSELSLTKETDDGIVSVSVLDYWSGNTVNALIGDVSKSAMDLESALAKRDEHTKLREQKDVVNAIKVYLDGVMELLHYLKPLRVSADIERNETFYTSFDRHYEALEPIISLYNRVRNYLTRKVGDVKKMKLMFDAPTLADGWDVNKERDNKTLLFEKEGAYYIGIIARGSKVNLNCSSLVASTQECYKKMNYKLLPGPNKMLPKVFFAKSNADLYEPSSELLLRYKNGEHIHGDSFNLEFCHELIDFFKESIAQHPDWKNFGFKFSETQTYRNISDFYREVTIQGYKVTFSDIPLEVIDDLVESGKLYLFQLWNKDFSPNAKGRPNLHTLYWKQVFSQQNLEDVVFALNGGAELFYRKASIKPETVHGDGQYLVNRIAKGGKPIPEAIYQEIYKFVNNKKHGEVLSAEAKSWYDRAEIKRVKHQIVKDRRYTEDKYFFHVPITINFKASDNSPAINKRIQDLIRNNKDVNIIGLDRGERNLIYLSLINQKGEIIKQKSFNTVGQMDYLAKLQDVSQMRDQQRKNWEQIGKIKDLKEGYLSAVIHDILTLMLEYNAIIVLEDLNFGFKRGRFCVEQQVYQKFEKMLIDKLNYFSLKTATHGESGSVCKGYQLAEKFESFKKLGKQTGVLFYVPAAYTSAIDPLTGFVNLFNLKKCTNAENQKAFLAKFKKIVYDGNRNAFAFAFDYSDFAVSKESYRKEWTVYSADARWTYDAKTKQPKCICPTQMIRDALLEHGVVANDGLDVLEIIRNMPAEKKTASFFKSIFYAFDRTLQMRNRSMNEDYIESPVETDEGQRFDSRKGDKTLPSDADANGAYHIALKGLWMLRNLPNDEKAKLPKLEHLQWFKFAQEKEWLK